MNRREIIAGLGSAAAWPLAAVAQQGDRLRRIGVLMPGDNENDPVFKPRVAAFTQALADLGWTDGRNVRIDLRWYGNDNTRARALAQELVGLQPDIIVTSTSPATAAVQGETRTIPIVFGNVAEPVASGIVPRLDRPGGNITGFGRAFEAISARQNSARQGADGWFRGHAFMRRRSSRTVHTTSLLIEAPWDQREAPIRWGEHWVGT